MKWRQSKLVNVLRQLFSHTHAIEANLFC